MRRKIDTAEEKATRGVVKKKNWRVSRMLLRKGKGRGGQKEQGWKKKGKELRKKKEGVR